jgi:4-hydroxybutyryl-CoA dehydratase/vinylacetyl-CoA-Delta-isomerase
MKQEIWRNYPVGLNLEVVARILDRGVLHNETPAITKNRNRGAAAIWAARRPVNQ